MSKELEERFASMVVESRAVLKENTLDELPHIQIGMATCGLAAEAAERLSRLMSFDNRELESFAVWPCL